MKKVTLPILSILSLMGLITLLSFNLKAPEKTNSFSDSYLPIWMSAKDQAIAIAKAMPGDKYNYKPTEVSKTFGEQMTHIAYTSLWVTEMFIKGEQKPYDEPKASEMTKDEIIALLEKNFDATAEIIKATSDWDAMTKSFAGNEFTKMQAMNSVQDHLTNHRAKANLYVRMNGIDPPKYGYY